MKPVLHVMLPAGLVLLTATTLMVAECVANVTPEAEIQSAIDGLENRLNAYRAQVENEAEAKRLFSYYYGGLMAKYRLAKYHPTLLLKLETRYVELTRPS